MAKRPDVIVRLGGDVTELRKAITRGEAVVRSFSDRISRVGRIAGGFGAAGFLGQIGSGFTQAIGNAVQQVAALEDVAEALDLTVERYGALEVAIQKTSEATRDDLIDVLKTFKERIGEAIREAGTAREQFQALGLDWVFLSQIPIDEAFLIFADALNKVTNTTVKASIANDLFEDKWLSIIPAIKEGTDALRAYRREALENPVVTTEAAESLDRFNRDIKDLSNQIETRFIKAIGLVASGYKAFNESTKETPDRIKEIRKEILELQTQLPESQNAFIRFLEAINILTPKTGEELGAIRDRIRELTAELERARQGVQEPIATPITTTATGAPAGPRELQAEERQVENLRKQIAKREKARKEEGLSDTRKQVQAEGRLWAAFHEELNALQEGQTKEAQQAQQAQIDALNDLFSAGASKEKLEQLLKDIGEADLPKPEVLMDVKLSPDALAELPQKLQDALVTGNYLINLQVAPSLIVAEGPGIDNTAALSGNRLPDQVGGI